MPRARLGKSNTLCFGATLAINVKSPPQIYKVPTKTRKQADILTAEWGKYMSIWDRRIPRADSENHQRLTASAGPRLPAQENYVNTRNMSIRAYPNVSVQEG